MTREDCDTRKQIYDALREFSDACSWKAKIDKTICYYVDFFYNYVRGRQFEMDKLAKNFGAFGTYDADLLLAHIIKKLLDACELKCMKFMKFQISLRD